MALDDKTILSIFKNVQNNIGFQTDSLNRREIPAILQKNKRRSKKDKTGRNYVCGCGKNYLSYPALYTHIKNKHEGVSPKGTTLQPQSRVKPGRPPKRADSPSKRSEMDGNSQNEEDGEMSGKQSENQSKMSKMEFTPVRAHDERHRTLSFRKEMLNLEDLELVTDLWCQGNASPTRCFIKERNIITNQFILHPIVDIINNLKADSTDDSFYHQLTCDKIFGIYLYSLSKFANQTFYDMVALIIRALRQCLNDKGYDLLQVYEAQNPTQKIELRKEGSDVTDGSSFCQIEPALYISIIFDYFLKEHLPKYLGGSECNLSFASSFLVGFNDWLLSNNLSRIKCNFFSYYD